MQLKTNICENISFSIPNAKTKRNRISKCYIILYYLHLRKKTNHKKEYAI